MSSMFASYARLGSHQHTGASHRACESPEQQELELLRIEEQMMALQRRTFGASSEKRPHDSAAAPAKPEPPTRPREQRKLPLDEHVHELAAGERGCATCGREMVEWNRQHEEVEEVDVVRRAFMLKKHLRKKYRCRCDENQSRIHGPRRSSVESGLARGTL